MTIPREEQDSHWTNYAHERLYGKRVVGVRYLSASEATAMDWYHRPLVIEFDDGSYVFPSKDDEGNDGGALFGGTRANDDEWTFPVLQGGPNG